MITSAASERKSRRSSTGIAAIAAKKIITVRTCIPGSRLANPLIVCERLPPLDFSRYNEPWLLCIMRAYGVFFFFFFLFFYFSIFPDSRLARSGKKKKTLESFTICTMYSYEVRTYVRRILRKIHVCTLIVPNHTNTLCHRLTFFQSSNSTQGEKWPLVHLYHRLLSCHTPPIRNQPSPYPILPYTLHYSVNIQLTSPHPHIPTILTYHFAPLPSLQQIEISIPRPLLHLLHLPLIPLPYPPPPPPPPSSPPPPPPPRNRRHNYNIYTPD